MYKGTTAVCMMTTGLSITHFPGHDTTRDSNRGTIIADGG